MNPAIRLFAIWIALEVAFLVPGKALAADAKPDSTANSRDLRVLLVTGNDYPGHLWRQTAPELKKLLELDPRLEVRMLENPDALGSTDLQEFSAVILHFMNWETPSPGKEARDNLKRFVEGGKGLVLVHFACGAWQDWSEFSNLAGRVWDPKLRGHDPHGTFRVEIADPDHPITQGMTSFDTTDELYTCLTGDRPIHVIAKARSKVDGKDYPMAFVFNYGHGRVFHTVLGHDVRAITNSAVPELLRRGTLWAAGSGVLKEEAAATPASLFEVLTDTVGQITITDDRKPVLRYNYRAVEPGDLLNRIETNNLKYAVARSDYIHPLYGPAGEELTKDWSIDHPHHRGIYWAWPEVDYRGERGDLHALQRVFARPSGGYSISTGPDFAQIVAENVWLWDDKEPIVRERATIRALPWQQGGRCIDLQFAFTAIGDDVAVARRGTDQYGGCLNIRLTHLDQQKITVFTGPAGAEPRMAWADVSGGVGKGGGPMGITILQSISNPAYPGDWVKFPELNWVQPTFPAAGARYVLKKGEPLTLRYRLWVHDGSSPAESTCADLWHAYQRDQEPR